MKKVNFYLSDFTIGGLENTLINVIGELKSDYDIQVYTLLKSRKVFENQKNITNMTRKSGFIRKVLGFVSYKLFKPRKADVNINWTHYNHYLSNICLRQKGKKIIWVHSNLEKTGNLRYIKKCKFNNFDEVVVVSDDSQEVIKRHGVLNSKRIYNLIHPDFEKINPQNKKYDFLNVARHNNASKNIKKFIDIARSNPDKKFVQVGNGKDFEENLDYSKGVDNIEFIGEAKAIDYMAQSKNFLLTSNSEGFSIVILEALTVGCKVYTTRCVKDFHNDFWSQYNGVIEENNELVEPLSDEKFNYLDYKNNILKDLRGVI